MCVRAERLPVRGLSAYRVERACVVYCGVCVVLNVCMVLNVYSSRPDYSACSIETVGGYVGVRPALLHA